MSTENNIITNNESFWSNNYLEYARKDDRYKTKSIKKSLEELRPHLKDITFIILKNLTRGKINLHCQFNFFSSKENDEQRVMYSKCHYSEIMINNKADEVIKELFESILNGYKIELKTSMRE